MRHRTPACRRLFSPSRSSFSPRSRPPVSIRPSRTIWSSLTPQPPKGPKIVFAKDAHDFGKIKQGDEPAFEFVFKNEGDVVLTIKNVETTCGCTAALVSEKKVEPGHRARSRSPSTRAAMRAKSRNTSTSIPTIPSRPASSSRSRPPSTSRPSRASTSTNTRSMPASWWRARAGPRPRSRSRTGGSSSSGSSASSRTPPFSAGGKPAKFPIKVAAGKEALVEISLGLANRIGPGPRIRPVQDKRPPPLHDLDEPQRLHRDPRPAEEALRQIQERYQMTGP